MDVVLCYSGEALISFDKHIYKVLGALIEWFSLTLFITCSFYWLYFLTYLLILTYLAYKDFGGL